jgi:iron complex outermembrane receptor protein
VTGGNEDLQPETANIFTAGMVYEPTFAPGVSLTLDYFNIDITNAIQGLGADLILQECYDKPADQRQYCDKIQRNPLTNAIDIINDTLTNVGGNDTAGIDVNLRFNQNTAVGAFNFNIEGTWLHAFNETLPNGTIREGKGVYDLGVFPDWRFNFSTLWGLKEWGAGANLRYIGAYRECENDDCKVGTGPEGNPLNDPEGDGMNILVPNDRTVSAHITGDLFGSYTLQTPVGTSRLSVGVNNVLDQTPAIVYNGFLASSDASTYDFIGRYFYARFSQQF